MTFPTPLKPNTSPKPDVVPKVLKPNTPVVAPKPDSVSKVQAPQLKLLHNKPIPASPLATLNLAPPPQLLHVKPAQEEKQPLFDDNDTSLSAYDKIPVKVTGRWSFVPIKSFNKLKKRKMFKDILLSNMKKIGYNRPTPIQQFAIPAMHAARDVCIVSAAGTGKTGAYLLPLLARALRWHRLRTANSAQPKGIVLVPTRELAVQVHAEMSRLIANTHVSSGLSCGGRSIASQVLEFRGGLDLLVATPGRLLDLLEDRQFLSLKELKVLVIDEAQRMTDLSLETSVRRILSHPSLPSPRTHQTVIVTAGLSNTLKEVFIPLLDPDHVIIKAGTPGATPSHIQQALVQVERDKKDEQLLADVARVESPILVFVNSAVQADKVAKMLEEKGTCVALLHGQLGQGERDGAIDAFKYGVAPVMVANSLASLGLDLPGVRHVINYDLPTWNLEEEYAYRVGRTGRGGRPGACITYVASQDGPHTEKLVTVLQASNMEVPSWLIAMADALSTSKHESNGNRNPDNATKQEKGRRENANAQPYGTYAAQAHGRQKGESALATIEDTLVDNGDGSSNDVVDWPELWEQLLKEDAPPPTKKSQNK